MEFKHEKNVHEEDLLPKDKYENWFTKFHYNNFDIEDVPCSVRSVEADEGKIKRLADVNRQITICKIAQGLHSSNSTSHIIHYRTIVSWIVNKYLAGTIYKCTNYIFPSTA